MFGYFLKKKRYNFFVSLKDEIVSKNNYYSNFSDEKIKEIYSSIGQKIKKDYSSKKTKFVNLDKYLVEVFSLVWEVVKRRIGINLFSTQILGGIALHYGSVAQMNTGEGKTLTAISPICLNALLPEGKIFLATVNDYLAKRDLETCKPVFDFFSISSGAILSYTSSLEKINLYENAKIIYTTGSRLCFDYLESNLVVNFEERLNWDPSLSVVFIDEIDSVLIDSSLNSMNISSFSQKNNELSLFFYETAKLISLFLLEKNKDYEVDEVNKTLFLNISGIKKVENFLNIDNLFSFSNHVWNALVHNALKANHFYIENIDYIVDRQSNKIVLIDSNTGRLEKKKVYDKGIQQAIEIKESVRLTRERKNSATITYQNFFRLFYKISGMTGTATEEEREFNEIYGMEVVVIPPYKKLIRIDKDDLIFFTKAKKYYSIVERIKEESSGNNRPILICSPNASVSKIISEMLLKEGIFHYNLSAVNYHEEEEIIAKSGNLGTKVLTTISRRGTDILLSEESKEKGGLLVLGVERSIRRVDDQIKGRAGRQGEPGETQFFVSLEDDLLKGFEEKISSFAIENLKILEEKPISGKLFNFFISEPQEIIKNSRFLYRKYFLDYDSLIDKQRRKIYSIRREILFFDKILKDDLEKKKDEAIDILKFIDNFWSEYLSLLEEIRGLINVRIYLPEDPQLSFFLLVDEIFKKNFFKIENKVKAFFCFNI